jgi:asparaginyl-tRNA synthetase
VPEPEPAKTAVAEAALGEGEEPFIYPGDAGPLSNTFVRNPPIEPKPVPLFAYGNRVRIAALHQNYKPYLDKLISVAGWARSTRPGGDTLFFIELNDGSCQSSLQIVVGGDIPNFDEFVHAKIGSSFSATGKLIRSPKDGQPFELQVCSQAVHKIKLVGIAPADKYPLPAKRLTKEYLRTQSHLRCRTKMISAVMRVRNNLAYATHKFFQERGFQYIHTPIITASDCEGAGEML